VHACMLSCMSCMGHTCCLVPDPWCLHAGGASLAFSTAYANAGQSSVGNIVPYLPNNLIPRLGLPFPPFGGSQASSSAGASSSSGSFFGSGSSANAGASSSANGRHPCLASCGGLAQQLHVQCLWVESQRLVQNLPAGPLPYVRDECADNAHVQIQTSTALVDCFQQLQGSTEGSPEGLASPEDLGSLSQVRHLKGGRQHWLDDVLYCCKVHVSGSIACRPATCTPCRAPPPPAPWPLQVSSILSMDGMKAGPLHPLVEQLHLPVTTACS
jgi:hypothetical protein